MKRKVVAISISSALILLSAILIFYESEPGRSSDPPTDRERQKNVEPVASTPPIPTDSKPVVEVPEPDNVLPKRLREQLGRATPQKVLSVLRLRTGKIRNRQSLYAWRTIRAKTLFRIAVRSGGMMKLLRSSLFVVVGLFLPVPAFAHHAMGGLTPQTFVQGLLSGLAHPVIGLDHFLFLLMAGVLVYSLRSPLKYATPVLFLVSALVGTSLHLAEFNLTNAEVLIALSLIASGGLVLWRRRVSTLELSLFFAVVGLFHGYAYAESIVGAENTPLLAYLVGLALTQYAVIVGMMTGLNRVNRLATGVHPERFAGGAALLGGALFLALSFV